MTEFTQEQIDAAEKQLQEALTGQKKLQSKLIDVYVDQLRDKPIVEPKKSRSKGMEPQTYSASDGPALFMEGPKVNLLTYGGTVVGKKKRIWVQPKALTEKPNNRVLRIRKNGDPKSLKGTTK